MTKDRQPAMENSIDSVLQEKEHWQGTEENDKQHRAMEAQPGLKRLDIESAREARLGATVHTNKFSNLLPSQQAARLATPFQEFGCTICHQIAPGKLQLTAYGAKLKSFQVACTDVEKVLVLRR